MVGIRERKLQEFKKGRGKKSSEFLWSASGGKATYTIRVGN